EDILDDLAYENPIKRPKEVFTFPISEKGRNTVHKHAEKRYQAIVSSLKKNRFDLIKYYLDDLLFLSNIFQEDQTLQSTYKKSLNEISRNISKEHEDTISQLNHYLQDHSRLLPENLQPIQITMVRIKESALLKSGDHKDIDLISPNAIPQYLENKTKWLL